MQGVGANSARPPMSKLQKAVSRMDATTAFASAAKAAQARHRTRLAERFFEALVSTQHGSAAGLAAACDTMHYYFLSVHDVVTLLDAMEERDMAHEDAMDMLHDGTLDLGDESFIQLRRISSDMMQCRRHEGRPATPGRPDSPKR